jgi:hypothetical protein
MTSDPGQREPRGRRPDIDLPRVVSVSSRLRRLDPPARRNFDSELPRLEQTVEFLVETEGPIPARALGPVLYVGDTPVTEVQVDDDTHYRFTALQPTGLQDGAPMTLGWSGQPASGPGDRQDTGLRFVAPEGFAPEAGQ